MRPLLNNSIRIDQDLEMVPQIALLQIVKVRFQAFEAKFGRLPEPNEPLFFDESQDHPVKANLTKTKAQLADGARRAGVELHPVLCFLGLAPKTQRMVARVGRETRALKAARNSRQLPDVRRPQSGARTPWDRFLANHRLHRRHRITRTELQELSRVSFLGETRSDADYIRILEMLRGR